MERPVLYFAHGGLDDGYPDIYSANLPNRGALDDISRKGIVDGGKGITMKFEAKKEYLKGYLNLNNKIVSLQTEYERWETIGTKVTPTLSHAPGGHGDNQSKVERASIEMARLKNELAEEIENATQKRDKIVRDINNHSPKVRHAQLLIWRYVNGMTLPQIARMIGKDERTVWNLINTAIRCLEL